MYEPQPRSRRYLNGMIYENGSLTEFFFFFGGGGSYVVCRRSPAKTQRAIKGLYLLELARARALTELGTKGARAAVTSDPAVQWGLMVLGDTLLHQ